MSAFTDKQQEQLLKPISSRRVLTDGKGHAHVSQQDITAHLIRMFGFGGFDTEVLSVECVFAVERMREGKPSGRFDVCYRALMRLTVRDQAGDKVCSYEDGSTATAQNQTLGDGHDLAYKSAISLAKKRCAINLGDQFGLSLYNKGQTAALVIGTLVGADAEKHDDVQADVPQQVSLGNDETDYEPEQQEGTSVAEKAQPDEPTSITPAMLRGDLATLAVDQHWDVKVLDVEFTDIYGVSIGKAAAWQLTEYLDAKRELVRAA